MPSPPSPARRIDARGTGRPRRSGEPHDGTGCVHALATHVVGRAGCGSVLDEESPPHPSAAVTVAAMATLASDRIIDPVEEVLERSMGLRSHENLRAEQE